MSDLPQSPTNAEPADGAPVLYRAEIAARLEEVSRLCTEVAALAQQRSDESVASLIDLGLSEALSNIVRHGYAPGTPGAKVQLVWTEQGDRWCLRVFDHGQPIPPSALEPAPGGDDPFDFDPLALESLPEGGMGLALLRSSFDQVEYRAGPGGNLLVLTKFIQPHGPATP